MRSGSSMGSFEAGALVGCPRGWNTERFFIDLVIDVAKRFRPLDTNPEMTKAKNYNLYISQEESRNGKNYPET